MEKLEHDYVGAVAKFDNCRAAIARTVEHFGYDPNAMPADDERAWHEWLIECLEAALAELEATDE